MLLIIQSLELQGCWVIIDQLTVLNIIKKLISFLAPENVHGVQGTYVGS